MLGSCRFFFFFRCSKKHRSLQNPYRTVPVFASSTNKKKGGFCRTSAPGMWANIFRQICSGNILGALQKTLVQSGHINLSRVEIDINMLGAFARTVGFQMGKSSFCWFVWFRKCWEPQKPSVSTWLGPRCLGAGPDPWQIILYASEFIWRDQFLVQPTWANENSTDCLAYIIRGWSRISS